MKPQKTNPAKPSFLIYMTLLTLVAFSFTGCSEDDVKLPDTSAMFVGDYSVQDISASGNEYNYDVTITKGNDGQIKISNFADMFNIPITATVAGQSFSIPTQTFTNPSGKKITLSASGSLANNTLTFSYSTVGYINYTGTCKAVRKN